MSLWILYLTQKLCKFLLYTVTPTSPNEACVSKCPEHKHQTFLQRKTGVQKAERHQVMGVCTSPRSKEVSPLCLYSLVLKEILGAGPRFPFIGDGRPLIWNTVYLVSVTSKTRSLGLLSTMFTTSLLPDLIMSPCVHLCLPPLDCELAEGKDHVVFIPSWWMACNECSINICGLIIFLVGVIEHMEEWRNQPTLIFSILGPILVQRKDYNSKVKIQEMEITHKA